MPYSRHIMRTDQQALGSAPPPHPMELASPGSLPPYGSKRLSKHHGMKEVDKRQQRGAAGCATHNKQPHKLDTQQEHWMSRMLGQREA